MAILERFWNWATPRKTQQRRDKPYQFKVPDLPSRIKQERQKPIATPDAQEMSSETRVKGWNTQTPSPESENYVDATLLPPSPPASAGLSCSDLDGDTLMPQSPLSTGNDKTLFDLDEIDANEDTMVIDDGAYMDKGKKIDMKEDKKTSQRKARDLQAAGWSEDAIFLFEKLDMRGHEAILPICWLDAFETLPGNLFTANLDKAFIQPTNGSDFRAQVALEDLLNLSGFARDAWLTKAPKRTPAFQIKQAIRTYAKWAMKDGKVDDVWATLPLFDILTFGRNIHAAEAERKMTEKLRCLHDRWKRALEDKPRLGEEHDATVPDVPTLYGVLASHTVMAFVSYAPVSAKNEKEHSQMIASFDFGKEDFDFWNELAVAVFVIHCRNRMIQLKDNLPQPKPSESDDPDA